MVRIFATLMLLALTSFPARSQDGAKPLEKRIEVLEGQKENLEKQSELIQKSIESKATQLDNQFSSNKIEIDKKLQTVDIIISLFGLGLIGTIIGFFIAFKNFITKKAEEVAEKRISETIENVIENNKNQIIDIVKSQDLEQQFRQQSKILIVSDAPATANETKGFLEEIGFKTSNLDIITSDKFIKPSKEFDLIILDDHKITKSHHDIFREFTEKVSAYFVFYGDRFDATRREKLNFANSTFTLYGQIVSTLKFKKLYDKKPPSV